MFRYHKKISMIADETISLNDYKFTLSGSEIDITEAILLDQPIEEAIKQSPEIAPVEGHKGGSDKSNLDVYDNPKKNKNGGRNVKHVAKSDHAHHEHSHEHNHDEKTYKRDYHQDKRNSAKNDKAVKLTDKSAEKEEVKKPSGTSGSRSGRNTKISKYYKSDSASGKTEPSQISRLPKQRSLNRKRKKRKRMEARIHKTTTMVIRMNPVRLSK